MGSIQKLSEATIRMIAAGEVITKPVNVIKELLENSLDAGSTNIRVTLEQGVSNSIEIIDNGIGIPQSDAELLCQRYATSKLEKAQDLLNVRTFGFRGEALASISEVAEIHVKTFNSSFDFLGWEGDYRSGQLVGQIHEAFVPNTGTCIKITNLFSNLSNRRKAMKAAIIEDRKSILDLLTRYAIHHREKVTIVFTDGKPPDLLCVMAPMDLGPCLGSLYGLEIENNLISVDCGNSHNYEVNARIAFSYKSASRSSAIFFLFVNDRLVECNSLKQEVDGIINQHLNLREYAPFMYIALYVPSDTVDVNTHPAKTTVTLQYQNEINALIITTLRETFLETFQKKPMKLNGASTKISSPSIVFLSSPENTITMSSSESCSIIEESVGSKRLKLLAPGSVTRTPQQKSTQMSTQSSRPYDLVHNDSKQTKLNQYNWQSTSNDNNQIGVSPQRTRRNLNLFSLRALREKVVKQESAILARTIRGSTFVGFFDHKHALIQYETSLYVINMKAFLSEQHYQFYLFDLGNFPPIDILPPGNNIKRMIQIYLDDLVKYEPKYYKELKFNTTDSVISKLLEHKVMLEDYLSITMNEDEILTIPNIIPQEIPNLLYLGEFFVTLVNQVNFSEELSCLKRIGRILSNFYSQPPANLKDITIHRKYHDLLEKKLWPAIKSYMIPPKRLLNVRYISRVSDTKDLYKVFERC